MSTFLEYRVHATLHDGIEESIATRVFEMLLQALI